MTGTPPIAKRVDHRRDHHGDVFVDPYEWLRDKSDPEVIAHLEAENAYAEQQTEHLAPLRQKIFDEIKARTKETDLSVPTRRDDVPDEMAAVDCRCSVALGLLRNGHAHPMQRRLEGGSPEKRHRSTA